MQGTLNIAPASGGKINFVHFLILGLLGTGVRAVTGWTVGMVCGVNVLNMTGTAANPATLTAGLSASNINFDGSQSATITGPGLSYIDFGSGNGSSTDFIMGLYYLNYWAGLSGQAIANLNTLNFDYSPTAQITGLNSLTFNDANSFIDLHQGTFSGFSGNTSFQGFYLLNSGNPYVATGASTTTTGPAWDGRSLCGLIYASLYGNCTIGPTSANGATPPNWILQSNAPGLPNTTCKMTCIGW